ncbi:hypothetical protein JW859_03240 [bacterium]|nr:hypothetical protein [bacterium]
MGSRTRLAVVLVLIALGFGLSPALATEASDGLAAAPAEFLEMARSLKWPEPGSARAFSCDGDPVVRDPLDPRNPYLAEYSQWDAWCYAHVVNPEDWMEDDSALRQAYPPGWVSLHTELDDNRWPLPLKQVILTDLAESLGYRDPYQVEDGNPGVTCFGPLDDELRRELAEFVGPLMAPYLPPLPAWLCEDPPLKAINLPDGGFAVLGELGEALSGPPWILAGNPSAEYTDNWPAHWVPADKCWTYYDADGNLIRKGQPGAPWWQVTFKDIEEHPEMLADDISYMVSSNGVFLSYDDSVHDPLGTFAYDGTRQDTSDSRGNAECDPRYLREIYGVWLPSIYASQQVVEPIPPCGWGVGTLDPAELDQSRPIAIAGYRFINIKPPTDEDGPYFGRYSEWDNWIYDELAKYCASGQPNQELVEKFQTELHFDYQYVLPGAASEPEYYYLDVNDQGYLVPLGITSVMSRLDRESNEQLGLDFADRRVGFEVWIKASLPLSLQAEYDNAWFVGVAPLLPAIPAWLVDSAPLQCVFLPERELAAQYANEGAKPSWRRYDAGGNLLGETGPGCFWWELYFTGFRHFCAKYGGVEKVNCRAYQDRIIINAAPDDDDLDLFFRFTYRGEPVDDDYYLRYDPLLFKVFPGDKLDVMHQRQLATRGDQDEATEQDEETAQDKLTE